MQGFRPHRFSDAPPLHPNLFAGALQLIAWLFCHPSAWRSHVSRVDASLRPGFALVELRRAHLRNPALRGLLIMAVGVVPLLMSALTAAALRSVGLSADMLVFGVVLCLTLSMALSALAGVVYGLAGSVAIGLATSAACAGAALLRARPANEWTSSQLPVVMLCLTFGIVGSMVGMFGQPLPGAAHSWQRKTVAVTIGALVGILLFITLIALMQPSVAGREAISIGIVIALAGLLVGTASAFGLGRRRGALVGLGAMIGLPFLFVILWLAGNVLEQALGENESEATWLVAFGSWLSVFVSVLYVLSAGLATRMAGATAGGMAGALASGLGLIVAFALSADLTWLLGNTANGIPLDSGVRVFIAHFDWAALAQNLLLGTGATMLGLTVNAWRPVLAYPFELLWNVMLRRADEQRLDTSSQARLALPYQSAFWDEWQRLPLWGLDKHILALAEGDPAAAQDAMTYLALHRQRWAAQAAQVELDARQLARCADAAAIAAARREIGAGELTGPASAVLRSFSRISQDVDAALRQESAYNRRLALSAVGDKLDGLVRELTRSDERYAARFRPVATQWGETISAHERALALTVEQRQEIDNPYVIGVPLTAQQEIFVGRADISARIEQLLLDRRRPPLLLYGQRRMGKTSLLNNLGRLLPSSIVPLFVDLQGPSAWASDHAGLLYNVARGMSDSARRQRGVALPPLARESLQADPFTRFDEWLDEVERTLGDCTALLALDEFETLDGAFEEKRFSEAAVLGMLRHIIQHRPCFKVLLAGSHSLDEAQRWSSYLINAHTVHIGYLSADEARTLITRPVEEFVLRYEPDAVERILQLTRCHPFLVQLLCAEIVACQNERLTSARRLARLADVESAAPNALLSGSFFFADIERNQVSAMGASLLRWLAARGEGATVARGDIQEWAHDTDAFERALQQLVRRELVERADGGYRFQVELVRRWFAREEI